jgi:hypothetical protein
MLHDDFEQLWVGDDAHLKLLHDKTNFAHILQNLFTQTRFSVSGKKKKDKRVSVCTVVKCEQIYFVTLHTHSETAWWRDVSN